jgi:hypothetical protein
LLFANAGFAIVVDDTIIPTAALQVLLRLLSLIFLLLFSFRYIPSHDNTLELINPLLNPVK